MCSDYWYYVCFVFSAKRTPLVKVIGLMIKINLVNEVLKWKLQGKQYYFTPTH